MERIADTVVHIVGIAAGTAATIALLWSASGLDSFRVYAGCALYACGLLAMLGLSAAYNLSHDSRRKNLLRRLDHAAIFLMIAGSYTPFALVNSETRWGSGMLAVVWTITLLGVVLKLAFPRSAERFSVSLYLIQGWVVVLALEPLIDSISQSSLILIAIGGILYTTGVIFYLSTQLRYHNVIWHSFVLLAASCHFAAIMGEVLVDVPVAHYSAHSPGTNSRSS